MITRRRAVAQPVQFFGRRAEQFTVDEESAPSFTLSDDVKLFALTFVGGFLFVSVYLA